MHKQQLEQVQQQQANSATTANSTQVSVQINCTAADSDLNLYNIYFLIDPPVIFKSCKLVTLGLLADPDKYIGPGQCSVCRLGPRDRRPTAGSENQGGARTRSQWRPLPLRYNGFPHNHWFDQ